ncbi:hypothetical protein ACU6ZR_24995 [Klebsiella aerogenes]
MNNELTAALLTIEKCRELSGCPAGVDLQEWVKQLAAENVALKQSKPSLKAMMSALDAFYADENVPESAMLIAFNILRGDIKTPATDRILAGIKADGVEEFAKHCDDSIGFVEPEDEEFYTVMEEHASDFAKQLREGADK